MFDDDDFSDRDNSFLYDPRSFRSGNSFLVPGRGDRDWEVESAPKPLTFHSIVRGVSRLGFLFAIGLGLTLTARIIPGAMPGYLVILCVSLAGCIIYVCLSRATGQRIMAMMIGVLILFGVIGGSWDAIYVTFSTPSDQGLFARFSAVGASLMASVGASMLFKRGV
ncbi:MAG: hypothetical protein KME10_23500 [Plectolyngbya sp. WJT66-NPBG17]|jgi:hypothetical protein|nr:hypothetical protein [Plectolyngbya sp. WJT66-NPBG17]